MLKALWASSRKASPSVFLPFARRIVIHGIFFALRRYTVTVRLAPVLPYKVATVQFPNVRSATDAVVEVLNKGVGIRTVHFLLYLPRTTG